MSEEKDQKSGTKEHARQKDKEIDGTPRNATPGSEDERDIAIRELTTNLESAKRQADLTRDQLLRKAAEFENYRRRNDAEMANLVRSANEELIWAILPIVNDFVRSLNQGRESNGTTPFFKGVELIYSKLMRVLEQQGVTTFDSVGKPFDVEFHDALIMIPRSDVPPHTVVEEIEKGYKLHDKVLRHAKVIVSSPPDIPPEAVQGSLEGTSSEID